MLNHHTQTFPATKNKHNQRKGGLNVAEQILHRRLSVERRVIPLCAILSANISKRKLFILQNAACYFLPAKMFTT